MDVKFTAVYRKVPEGFIAFVEELPGANTQGATLEEAPINNSLEGGGCPGSGSSAPRE